MHPCSKDHTVRDSPLRTTVLYGIEKAYLRALVHLGDDLSNLLEYLLEFTGSKEGSKLRGPSGDLLWIAFKELPQKKTAQSQVHDPAVEDINLFCQVSHSR